MLITDRTNVESPMSKRVQMFGTAWLVGAGAAAAASGLVLAAVTSETGFEQRLAAATSAPAAPRIASVPHDGTEDFWLTQGRPDAIQPVVLTTPLAIGGDLPKGLDRDARALEIISIRQIESNGAEQLLLVTCRDRSAGDNGQPVRFLIQAPAAAAPAPQRTL
jgi:hypothetical protein